MWNRLRTGIQGPVGMSILILLVSLGMLVVYCGAEIVHCLVRLNSPDFREAESHITGELWDDIKLTVQYLVVGIFGTLYIGYRKGWMLVLMSFVLLMDFFWTPNPAVNFSGILICLLALYHHLRWRHKGIRPGRKQFLVLANFLFCVYAMLHIFVVTSGYELWRLLPCLFLIGSVVLISISMKREGLLFVRMAGGCYLIGTAWLNLFGFDPMYIFVTGPQVLLAIFLVIVPSKWIDQMDESKEYGLQPPMKEVKDKASSRIRSILTWKRVGWTLTLLILLNVGLHLFEILSPVHEELENGYVTVEENHLTDGIFAFGSKTLYVSGKDGNKVVLDSGSHGGELVGNLLVYQKDYREAIKIVDMTNKFHRKGIYVQSICQAAGKDFLVYIEETEDSFAEDNGNLYLVNMEHPKKKIQLTGEHYYWVEVYQDTILAMDEKEGLSRFSSDGTLLSKVSLKGFDPEYFREDGFLNNGELVYSREDWEREEDVVWIDVFALDTTTGKSHKLVQYIQEDIMPPTSVQNNKIYFIEKNKLKAYDTETDAIRTLYTYEACQRIQLFPCRDYMVAELDLSEQDNRVRVSVDYQGNLIYRKEMSSGFEWKWIEFMGWEIE